MSNYKGIKGFQVQTRTEDPVPYAQALADNPYAGAWASAANMNTARDNLASVGTTTAALGSGGFEPPLSAKSEEWDGSSWTEGNDLNTARSHFHGAGVQTSAIVVGGESPSLTNAAEEYDGTSYTTVTAYPGSKASIGALGATNTAALFMGGYPVTTESFEYDGTNYTEGGDLNTGREDMAAAGTQTAGIAIGGSPRTAVVEQYNGSAWTEVSDLNTARNGLAASHQSSYTSVLAFGGNVPGTTAVTESWDGSSWTEVADLATARYDLGGSGNSNQSALAFAGGTPSRTTATELWTFSGLDPSSTPAADYADAIIGDFYYNSTTGQFKTVNDGGPPIGSWSSGGNLPTNYINQGAFGGRDSVTTGGGSKASGSPARVGDSFQYDGASWSEIAELNTGRDQLVGLGTQNSGLVAAGYRGTPTATVGICENWNGSSWTEVADLSPVRTGAGSAGVYTAGLVFGGNVPPLTASTMTWDGSAWTEVNDLNSARNRFMGQAIGTQTAALAVSGEGVNGTESWNGTSWTEVNDMNTVRHLGGGSGIQTSAIVSTGRTGAPGYNPNAACESWDGTSFTEVADVSSARAYLSSAGTAAGNTNSESIIFGGATTSSTANTAATEEWNAADFQIKSVTTS